MPTLPRLAPPLALVIAALAACSTGRAPPPGPEAEVGPLETPAPREEAPPAPPEPPPPLAVHEGGALARAPGDDALYVADEDGRRLLRVALPIEARTGPVEIPMPGPPAQVLALGRRVLATVRSDGDAARGLLLIFEPDPDVGLREVARVALPADAWGVAVTPDEETAIVTSAWTHEVSAVDLASAKVRWTASVPREPRAVVVRPDGASAYVTHLVGAAITRIDGIGSEAPVVRAVALPAAPLRAPIKARAKGAALDASLAYSAVLSPDGGRLFVPRHALGALGKRSWFGQPTVDVLITRSDAALAPDRENVGMRFILSSMFGAKPEADDESMDADGAVPMHAKPPFTQPRAVAYRRSQRTLLVAGEGDNLVAELDALSVDPSLKALETYELGGKWSADRPAEKGCGAPTGLALSADEDHAFVYCRTSGDVAAIELATPGKKPEERAPMTLVHLADAPLSPVAAIGRRLFFDATDGVVSGGLACNGCHPEGRDDGHVYQEVTHLVGFSLAGAPIHTRGATYGGFARQTPMLAGRVGAKGPYGWHGKSETLEARVTAGFEMHRWEGEADGAPTPEVERPEVRAATSPDLLRTLDTIRAGNAARIAKIKAAAPKRALAIALYARQGLVPPPREARALTDEEAAGKEIFLSQRAGCAGCHVPETGYTDRGVVSLGDPPTKQGFADEDDRLFKTPSLLYVGGTPPYFHDGRAATLEELVDKNHDRMGHTDHLKPTERASLVAFLRTL